jgi:nucleotide-binding universal stress UspA family protein
MRKILVALDRSLRSELVLQRAAAVAQATRAELYLVRAVSLPTDVPDEAYSLSPTELVERWKKDAARDLEARAATLPTDLVVHVLTRTGSPWSAICEAAREHEVDLIVIGSHGYDTLDHVLGTTAAKVVNHADRSVLVVKR